MLFLSNKQGHLTEALEANSCHGEMSTALHNNRYQSSESYFSNAAGYRGLPESANETEQTNKFLTIYSRYSSRGGR